MRYVLIDNAVVQCDKIANHIILDTSRLFEEKEYCLFYEYEPIFNAIKRFLISDGDTCELFVSSHFYFVPCFVLELQKFLGGNVHAIPINSVANNKNMMEYYDNHAIKSEFDNGFCKCTISKIDTTKRVKQVVDKIPIQKDTDISFITNVNDYIDHLESLLSIGDFCELVMGDNLYQKIVVGGKGYFNFSPFGSLRYYEELKPRIYGFEFFRDTSLEAIPNSDYSYVMSTLSGDISFNNRYQTWINTEKKGLFPIKCLRNNKEKWRTLMISDSIMEENEIQINDMRFGKFYVDMECDFLGNLHLCIESLSGKTFYQILQFAL